jgi:hypothetical protein
MEDYQAPLGASQSVEKLAQMQTEQANVTTHDDMGEQRERVMFERHVETNGEKIPQNFKTAGEWFDSLKEAQKQYTQGQQEISALKEQYSKGGVTNPDYVEDAVASETTDQMETPNITGEEELRLQTPVEPEVVPPPALSGELWDTWSSEFAINGGLSDETYQQIQQVTNFPRQVIDDYISAQGAKRRESFTTAAGLVGGQERLKTIFDWAESTLSADEQAQINLGLASNTYEVTLRGLASMYDQKSAAAVKSQEPSTTPGLENVAASEQGFTGYKTKREFSADRNNPRFGVEPKFREAVEQRMMRTDFNTLSP